MMTKNSMGTLALLTAIIAIILAVIVFIFADGLRRWYSGIFFLLIGIVMLVNYARWRHGSKE